MESIIRPFSKGREGSKVGRGNDGGVSEGGIVGF